MATHYFILLIEPFLIQLIGSEALIHSGMTEVTSFMIDSIIYSRDLFRNNRGDFMLFKDIYVALCGAVMEHNDLMFHFFNPGHLLIQEKHKQMTKQKLDRNFIASRQEKPQEENIKLYAS